MMEQCKENETMKNYKIAVAGTGYVGLSIATLLSQHHQVIPMHLQEAYKELMIPKGALPIAEEISANIIKTYRMPRDTSKEYEPIVRVSNNRISLLKNAKGKYITFLDGDDYYSDCCKLQKQVDALEKHPECVGCGHPINMKWEENPTRPAQSVGTVASKAVIIPTSIYCLTI